MSSMVEKDPTLTELNDKLDLFQLTGSSIADSSKADFFQVYSNSDFMRHFRVIKEDHKDVAVPTSIKIKAKAIKKFLPYEGFYPCQRTVQLAQRFHDSYHEHIVEQNGDLSDDRSKGLAIYVPLFAPGILFNTIKSGIACDYPVFSKQSEQIKKFSILPRDFSIDEGELTPTLKIRRKQINDNWAKTIDEMYSE